MAQIYGYILGDICIKLCDEQVVQLKPHEFGEVLSKLEQFSLQKTCFEKLNLLSSLSILQAIQSFFLS